MLRPVHERVRSDFDHNVVPGTQSATNVRAHKERLPFATFVDKSIMTMPGWDQGQRGGMTVSVRAAQRARAADYR